MCKVMITVTDADGHIQQLWVTLPMPEAVFTVRIDALGGFTHSQRWTGTGHRRSHIHRIRRSATASCKASMIHSL